MAAIYVANIVGDGQTPETAWRPAGFDGATFAVMMADEVKGKAIVYSPDDTITGPGISRFLQAVDRSALIALARTTRPTAGQRNAIANWLTNAGYVLPDYTGNPTWWQVLHYMARQVNAAADLDTTSA